MSLDKIKSYADSVLDVYGTEDFSVYLYSLIKMQKLRNIVEYGTGLGSAALWCGQACKENGFGKVHTVDLGIEWEVNIRRDILKAHREKTHAQYITELIKSHALEDYIELHNEAIDFEKSYSTDPIDILFSDYNHGTIKILELLANLIPKMSRHSYIFIDGASCYLSSYWMLENLISILNTGRIPQSLMELASDKDGLKQVVQATKFSVSHIIENKQRKQNNTACITLSPLDIMPYDKQHITI
jgi:hypothetical protein